MQDLLGAAPKPNWREEAKWPRHLKITKEDLLNGSDCVEKLNAPPWLLKNKGEPEPRIGFGKYAELTHREVKEKNRNYFDWMCDNNNSFRVKAAKLGLLS